MKLRIQAALLAAVLLLSAGLWVTPAMAAGTVTVSDVSGTKGELVDVEITLTSDDVCSGNFNVCYDSAALELVDAVSTDAFYCFSNAHEPGLVRVTFTRVTTITDALLCTLTFRVTADTSADGSTVDLSQVKLYNEEGIPVSSSVMQGSVARKTVRLSMRISETAEYQAVRAVVDLGGSLSPAGGNFSVAYDPAHFTITAVLPLEGMGKASYEYHIVEPGLVRVAFSSATALESGELCALVFQTVGHAGEHSELTISDARVYDENADLMDVSIVNGSLSIVVPSDADPKLWVVGGAIENNAAKVAVVLQGRGYACGGNFVLHYDSTMTAVIEASADCQINHDPETGTIFVSWASPAPYIGEWEMLTIHFDNAVRSTVEIDRVMVYYDEGKAVPVVDVRPGQISTADVITAMIDEVSVETVDAQSNYIVAVDVADLNYFSEDASETITTAMALYENGRMVGITMQPVFGFKNGVSEVQLSAATSEAVTDIHVFLMDGDDGMAPLHEALAVNME